MKFDERERWKERSKCSPETANLFFSTSEVKIKKARKLCRACPVRNECLEYAIENHEDDGIWGDTDGAERRRIVRKRREQRKAG